MAYDRAGVFTQAVAALHSNPSWGLKALSVALGVERHTVERAFRSNAAKSFRAFKRECLLRRSMELLASKPTASLKEIAFLLGYKSQRAFARSIKGAFGCCPCELRRRLTDTAAPSDHMAALDQPPWRAGPSCRASCPLGKLDSVLDSKTFHSCPILRQVAPCLGLLSE
jgi:AraC-like DNA-binding protein